MMRIDEDALSLHIEVALASSPRSLLDDLDNGDRHRRNLAVSAIARELAERLRCFDIQFVDQLPSAPAQPTLFLDMGPMG
ncbi:hypothetical protein [Novosphingobium percolationis]|uniref:hypothetical protein n=1 Tax=Novosphingobium percolationis TaxID=2871811 RepID=UPI001CD2D800|nr:hypothetical protein [Novosphingobium percolationis]